MPACPTPFAGSSTRRVPVPGSDTSGFQLRFRSLFREGRGYSFPCDATGKVDLDGLSERARLNYLFARAMVGRDLHMPEFVAGEPPGSGAGDEGPASCCPESPWHRAARRH
jgi:hypothetical protein